MREQGTHSENRPHHLPLLLVESPPFCFARAPKIRTQDYPVASKFVSGDWMIMFSYIWISGSLKGAEIPCWAVRAQELFRPWFSFQEIFISYKNRTLCEVETQTLMNSMPLNYWTQSRIAQGWWGGWGLQPELRTLKCMNQLLISVKRWLKWIILGRGKV